GASKCYLPCSSRWAVREQKSPRRQGAGLRQPPGEGRMSRLFGWLKQGPELRPVDDDPARAIGAQLADDHLDALADLDRPAEVRQLRGDHWPFVELDQRQRIGRERLEILSRGGDGREAVDRALAGEREQLDVGLGGGDAGARLRLPKLVPIGELVFQLVVVGA